MAYLSPENRPYVEKHLKEASAFAHALADDAVARVLSLLDDPDVAIDKIGSTELGAAAIDVLMSTLQESEHEGWVVDDEAIAEQLRWVAILGIAYSACDKLKEGVERITARGETGEV